MKSQVVADTRVVCVVPPPRRRTPRCTPRATCYSLPVQLSAACINQNGLHRQFWGIPDTKINIQPHTHKHLRKINIIKEKHPTLITMPPSKAAADRQEETPPHPHPPTRKAKLSSLLLSQGPSAPVSMLTTPGQERMKHIPLQLSLGP